MYEGREIRVKIGEEISVWLEQKSGLRKGSAQLLFIIAMDEIMPKGEVIARRLRDEKMKFQC